eukprot:3953183-Prymnesium_polylepis.1
MGNRPSMSVVSPTSTSRSRSTPAFSSRFSSCALSTCALRTGARRRACESHNGGAQRLRGLFEGCVFGSQTASEYKRSCSWMVSPSLSWM